MSDPKTLDDAEKGLHAHFPFFFDADPRSHSSMRSFVFFFSSLLPVNNLLVDHGPLFFPRLLPSSGFLLSCMSQILSLHKPTKYTNLL